MALEVSQIADAVKPLDIPLPGGVLHVEYYPGRLNLATDRLLVDKARAYDERLKARLAETATHGSADEKEPGKAADKAGDDDFWWYDAERLCLVLASWDLVDKGKPVPIEPKAFGNFLGRPNTTRIAEALYADRDLPNAKNS